MKDNIATLSQTTTCASAILSSYTSPFEATVVRQLRDVGADVVGKTNMDEFGMGSHSVSSHFGPVGAARSLGGSSGGSAAAVLLDHADVALGTDTGGSVRLPAAYAGVAGYKPSYGLLSRFGVVPYANSLDTVGLLARDVATIRRLVIGARLWREHDARDPTSLSAAARARIARRMRGYDDDPPHGPETPRGEAGRPAMMTIGLPLEYNIQELSPEVRRAWNWAAETCAAALGARVAPVSLPMTKHALSAYYVIAPAEASSNLAKYDGVRYGGRRSGAAAANDDPAEKEDGEEEGGPRSLYAATRDAGFGPEVKRRILLGSYTLSSDAMDNYFIQAQKVRQLVRRDFDRVFRLANPLRDEPEQFDLADMDPTIPLRDKTGPEQVDFLLCPTAPTPPPRLSEVQDMSELEHFTNDVFTVPASLAGLPAISIPFPTPRPWGAVGSQIEFEPFYSGLQIIGQYGDDARLLQFAELLMRESLGGDEAAVSKMDAQHKAFVTGVPDDETR